MFVKSFTWFIDKVSNCVFKTVVEKEPLESQKKKMLFKLRLAIDKQSEVNT